MTLLGKTAKPTLCGNGQKIFTLRLGCAIGRNELIACLCYQETIYGHTLPKTKASALQAVVRKHADVVVLVPLVAHPVGLDSVAAGAELGVA